jgi:hypothetical protein
MGGKVDEEDTLPLTDDELESLSVRAAVALEMPPGTVAPEPRPRKDVVEEAYGEVLRLVKEVRRLRRRDARWRDALRAALSANDPEAVRRTVNDVLDDSL